MSRSRKKLLLKVLVLCVLSVGAYWRASAYEPRTDAMVVDYLDVGQGDSILVTLPSGFQLLIDGGPDQRVLSQLREVMPLGDRSIDLLMLTHGDADHLTGLVDVVRDYDVGLVLMPDAPKDTALYREWQKLLKDGGQAVQLVQGKLDIPLTDGAILHLLHPTPQTFGKDESANDASIVARLDYGSTKFLFTGDIEAVIEDRLVKTSADVDADILKVPHHGSKTSSTAAFLAAVSPAASVIQAGFKNKYGHPHIEVLDRLSAMGPVFRTDQEGRIRLISDGCLIEKSALTVGFLANIVGNKPFLVYNACTER